MPGAVKRRSRNASGGQSLFSGNNVSMNKRSKLLDPDMENAVTEKTLLLESLNNAGMIVKNGDDPNVLKEDQAIFLKKFNKDITTAIEYPENITRMFDTLSTWLEDEIFLSKCLSPTLTSTSCSNARSSQQDSLLRLLLNCADLQPLVLDKLLEKLAEISLMQEGKKMIESQYSKLPRYVIFHMKDLVSMHLSRKRVWGS